MSNPLQTLLDANGINADADDVAGGLLDRTNDAIERLGVVPEPLPPGAESIETWNDLDGIRDDSDGDYVLVANLNEATEGYDEIVDPEGNGFEPIENFGGEFNGRDNEIADLVLNIDESGESFGVFGSTTSDAEIRDLTLADVTTTGDEPNAGFVGALAGTNDGDVINAAVTGSVTAQGSVPVGGLVGNNVGTISDSNADVTVESGNQSEIGGLVAVNDGTIENSHAEGDVEVFGAGVNPTVAGGLVGLNNAEATVDDSSAAATVTGGDAPGGNDPISVGGLVGINEGSITDADAAGSVNGGETQLNVGGLVGLNTGSSATVERSFAMGDVEADDVNIGGLVGNNIDGGTITESFATGDATGGDDAAVGGLTGVNQDGGAAIEKSYAMGAVEAGDGTSPSAGGLVGDNFADVTESYATGSVVVGEGFAATAGGLVGNQSDGSLTGSYWDKQTTGQDDGADAGFDIGGDVDIEGLETDEMQDSSAQETMNAFDFGDTWDTVENDYPVL